MDHSDPPAPPLPYAGDAAIVFGGTSGIGAATAELLAERGAAVTVVGRRAEQGEAVAERCRAGGAPAGFTPADVTDDDQVAAAVAAAVAAHGPLTMAVNSAGVDIPRPFDELTPDDYEAMFSVNARGTWSCLRHEIAAMRDTGRGAIVNVGSIAAAIPILGNSLYGATKRAVTGLTRSAAYEWAAVGIRVNEVDPGTTRTEMLDHWLDEVAGDLGIGLADVERSVALGRLSTPREQALAIAFLLSDEASFITGTTLTVDGGTSLLSRVVPTPTGAAPATPGDIVAARLRTES